MTGTGARLHVYVKDSKPSQVPLIQMLVLRLKVLSDFQDLVSLSSLELCFVDKARLSLNSRGPHASASWVLKGVHHT